MGAKTINFESIISVLVFGWYYQGCVGLISADDSVGQGLAK